MNHLKAFSTSLAILAAIATAQPAAALDIDATTFFAACPGPIFLAESTTITGTATVEGDCVVSSPEFEQFATETLTFDRANVTFNGELNIAGTYPSVLFDRSTIIFNAAEDKTIQIDAGGTVTFSKSHVQVSGGTHLRITPQAGTTINGSTFTTDDDLLISGADGAVRIEKSTLSIGNDLQISQGGEFLATTTIVNSEITTGGRLEVAGRGSPLIERSTLQSNASGDGVVAFSPAGSARTGTLVKSEILAPNGSINIDGGVDWLISKSTVRSERGSMRGTGGEIGVRISPGGSITLEKALVQAPASYVQVHGQGPLVLEKTEITAGAADGSNTGISLGTGLGTFMTGGLLQTQDGTIRIVIAGDGNLDETETSAFNGGDIIAPGGIIISGGANLSVFGTTYVTTDGPFLYWGDGPATFERARIGAFDGGAEDALFGFENGVNFGNSGNLTLIKNMIQSPDGPIYAGSTGNINLEKNKVTAGGTLGLVAESSAGSVTTATKNKVAGDAVALRSFQDTTATKNKMKDVAGDIEFSAAVTCTSTKNKPDVPCL